MRHSPFDSNILQEKPLSFMRPLLPWPSTSSSILVYWHRHLGVWIWGALLRRELLSIPHAIFGFIEQHRERHTRWWPSARHEARLMAWATCFMAYEASAPLCPVVFATDAQGASHLDAGGFGIVCRSVKPSLINE